MAEQKRNGTEDLRRKAQELRDAQRRKSSMVRTFIIVIVLGLLVGAGIAFKDQIQAVVSAWLKPPPAPAPKAAPPAPPPVVAREVEKAPPPPPPVDAAPRAAKAAPATVGRSRRAFSSIEDEQAKTLVAQGKAAFENMEFGRAASLFGQAAKKNASQPVVTEAETLERRATSYDSATRHIASSKYAIAETSCIIETVDGRRLNGLIKSENDEQVMLQVIPAENPATVGESVWPLPKSEVAKRTTITREQRQKEFLDLLGALEQNVSVQRSTDYYDLVYVSKRLGLMQACMAYLNRAFDGGPGHPPDPYLGDSFRKERVRRTIEQCSLMLASGRAKHFVQAELNKLLKAFPGYAVAQDEVDAFKMQVFDKVPDDFKPTLREVRKPAPAVALETKAEAPKAVAQSAKQLAMKDEEIEFVVESGGVQGRGAAGPVVEAANQNYEDGMKLYRGYRQGTNSNNNQSLKAAMAKLEKAVGLYAEALQKDPTNKAVLDRQTEANMIVYACKKYQTL
jgi:tetratricopeptide (TPR) repeat protein